MFHNDPKGTAMKTRLPVFLFTVLLVVAGSCKKDDVTVVPAPQESALKIDSLKLEKNVPNTDTLRARLWAKIGNTSCYQFSRFQEVSRDSFSTTIRAYYTYTAASNCMPQVVELKASIYRVYPIYPGIYRFTVLQPDGTALRDTSRIL